MLLRSWAVALSLLAALGAMAVQVPGTSAMFTDADAVADNRLTVSDCFTTDFTSVQSGTAASSADGTTTVSIEAVDLTKAFLTFSTRHNSNRPVGSAVRGRLASSTTLEFARVTDESPVSTISIQWSVVQYACGISVQRGELAQSATTVDVAIAPVRAISQAFVLWSKTPTATDGDWGEDDTLVSQLTSTTNLQFRSNGATPTHTISWQVIEFARADNIHVQQGTTSLIGSTATTTTVTLPTPVDPSRTFILVDARSFGSGPDIGERLVRARLSDATTITIDRSVAGPDDDLTEITWQAVELKDGSTVQSGSAAFATGAAEATGTINPVDTRRAVAFGSFQHGSGQNMGRTAYLGDDVPGAAAATLAVTSSTTVTLTRANTADTADVGWSVVEWGLSADIKSVQSGTATNNQDGTTAVTITGVDPAKAFLLFSTRHDSNRPAGSAIRGRIASPTSIEFARATNESPVSTISIQWYVVEYARGVSVQRGEVTQSGTIVDVPITPVASMRQAFVLWSKTPVSTENDWGADDAVAAKLTTDSNLQFRADQANTGHTLWWQVVEFTNPTDIAVQRGTTSLTGAALSTTVTVPTAVDPARTFVLVDARTIGDGPDIGARLVRARLIDATTISIDRGTSGSPDDLTEITWQAVELNDGSTVQSGSTSFATGAAQAIATVTPLDTSRAAAFGSFQHGSGQNMGNTSYTADDVLGVAAATIAATSSTQLTLDRSSTAGPADIAWFAVLFGG